MPTLAPRQIEIVRHLAQGQRSKEIAADLHLQITTVNGYVAEIWKKWGAKSNAEIVAMAIRAGLI